MSEEHLGTRSLTDCAGRVRTYRYSILVDTVETGHWMCESYGICISEEGGERAAVAHITLNAGRIGELGDLLLRNGVTPIQLQDVIADWL